MQLDEILIGGGILFGLVGVWDNFLLPNINSLPANIQNAALKVGIDPDYAFIPSPSAFSENFWYYVGGGLVGTGFALRYGSNLVAVIIVLAALFLLYNDYSSGNSQLVTED